MYRFYVRIYESIVAAYTAYVYLLFVTPTPDRAFTPLFQPSSFLPLSLAPSISQYASIFSLFLTREISLAPLRSFALSHLVDLLVVSMFLYLH